MSTLSTLKTLLTQKLATSQTGFHSSANRTAAINEAIGEMALEYEIPELLRKGTLTITSGVAAFPTNFLRMIKLWDVTDQSIEFTYIYPDQFDGLSASTSYYWTIDYNVAAAARRILVLPTSKTSAYIRYMVNPTEMSAESDDSGISSLWDDAIAYRACAVLFRNEQNPAWQLAEQMADDHIKKITQALTPDGGAKAGNRLISRYEKYPLLEQ